VKVRHLPAKVAHPTPEGVLIGADPRETRHTPPLKSLSLPTRLKSAQQSSARPDVAMRPAPPIACALAQANF
jgi:hypothetical protein